MKAWFMSDLHLDVGPAPLDLVDRPDHDLVVIAGDICEHFEEGISWIAEQGLNEKPVVVVGGNHEFYRDERDGGLERGREAAAKHRNIHVLQDEVLDLNTDPLGQAVRIIGTTLWTDYGLFGERNRVAAHTESARRMNDHRFIRLARDGGRRWTTEDAYEEHLVSRAFIERELERTPPWQIAVVLTHHAPSMQSLPPDRRIAYYNAAYASNLDAVAARANFWLHGHIHPAVPPYRIGDCRVISNPRGYAYQGQDYAFDPKLVIDLATPANAYPVEAFA